MSLLGLLLVIALIGSLPAPIYRGKGRSFGIFLFCEVIAWVGLVFLMMVVLGHGGGAFVLSLLLCGALVFAVGLLVASLTRDKRWTCPNCREVIRQNATVCPHCQRDVHRIAESTRTDPISDDPRRASRGMSQNEDDAATRIARERYARGEISRDDFVEIRDELSGAERG